VEGDGGALSEHSKKSKYSRVSKQSAFDHESLLEQIGLKEDNSQNDEGDGYTLGDV